MASKEDYKAIAKIIRDGTIDCGMGKKQVDKLVFISKLADYFEQDNPHFNRNKFIGACWIK